MVILHCEMWKTGEKQYEAVCLENSVAAVGTTPADARRRLDSAIAAYLEDISEEFIRLVREGKLDPKDDNSIHAEIHKYMQRVRYYPLRLARWNVLGIFNALMQKRKRKDTPPMTFQHEGAIPLANA